MFRGGKNSQSRYKVDGNNGDARIKLVAQHQLAFHTNATFGAKKGTAQKVSSDGGLSVGDNTVIFEVMPDITVNASANYVDVGDILAPASIVFYMGSPSRTFSLSAKFVARTVAEGLQNLKYINMLQSWRMPERRNSGMGSDTTPSILKLYGYGDVFKGIPVVMTDLTIELSSEHDYLNLIPHDTITNGTYTNRNLTRKKKVTRQVRRAGPKGEWYDTVETTEEDEYIGTVADHVKTITGSYTDTSLPIITNVNISLKETHTTGPGYKGLVDGLNDFDIVQYRNGKLIGW